MKQYSKHHLWKTLTEHAKANLITTYSSLKKKDPSQFRWSACGIELDYSNQHVTLATIELLIALAKSCHLKEKIIDLINGKIVNNTEQRPALHTALRASEKTWLWVNDQNIMNNVMAARQQMKHISDKIRNGLWLNDRGQAIKNIVNIGIGGSDLGPKFCLHALKTWSNSDLNYAFISDADPNAFEQATKDMLPQNTLFIISSKSFTTAETLYNAKKAMRWIRQGNESMQQHFVAVTANVYKAQELGINTIVPIWDWVGGRYSFCSAINLISAIAIGFDNFDQILSGARAMDEHFYASDFHQNLPILSALLGVWNNNFLSIHNLLMLTYSQQLDIFVPYIQQLEMESNGKSINNQGQAVNHATGPIVWGGPGNQAQHSYYQLLCQGTHKTTVDLITIKHQQQNMLNQMALAKINVLTQGVDGKNNPYGFIPGLIPLNHIRLDGITPKTLGALVAFYEHKVFTQSVIWDINPFDQPGVESAKQHCFQSVSPIKSPSLISE